MPLGASRLNTLSYSAVETAVTRDPITITTNGDAKLSTAQSKFGNSSGFFDGSGDFLTGTFPARATDSWTVEGWVYNTSWATVESFSAGTGSASLYFYTGRMAIYIGGASYGASTLTTNAWNHVAWVSDGSAIRMFLNGVYDGSRGSASDHYLSFHIASNSVGANSFSGYMDEIRMSNVARYPGTTTFTPSTSAFTNDADTILLLHMDGSNNSTTFTDDGGA